ncbi:MAG: radical SAM protein [Terracidiphilus sp.]|nr:radical SAM protein [Terracidiphilus sp.]
MCLRRVEAERVSDGTDVYLQKSCPEHGEFSTVLWRGVKSYLAWTGGMSSTEKPGSDDKHAPGEGCPFECGLCDEHLQSTCCVILEVTNRCNLSCPVCFANAEAQFSADLSFDAILDRCRSLLERVGRFNLQLSGGEPTMRNDLPEIVSAVRALGVPFVQLNTNGLRLAAEPEYAAELQQAGLDCVFLQFDGVSDDVYAALRGRSLFDRKLDAIHNCAKAQLGVVLVPTLVPGVNTGEIGAILRFACAHLPAIRAVHFQPVSFFGRYPHWTDAHNSEANEFRTPGNACRITIPEILDAIETQTGGMFRVEDFRAPMAEHASCSFQGRFHIGEDGMVRPAAQSASSCCSAPQPLVKLGAAPAAKSTDSSSRARQAVARQWAFPAPAPDAQDTGTESFDAFLAEGRRTLSISGMAFQDAWNLDVERLRRCFLHVAASDGKLIPLCAYNLTAADGTPLYRGKNTLHGEVAR